MATPAEIFENINANIEKNPEKAKSVNSIFQFDITGDDGGTWVVDLRESADGNYVSQGANEEAEVTISVASGDWTGIVDGSINAMQAFMMGKIKVKGDMGKAMKLQNIMSLG